MKLRTVVLCLSMFSAGSRAQTTGEQFGLSIAAGGGVGALRITCDGCGGPSQSSTTWYARLGYAASPRVVVGVGMDQWSDDRSFERRSATISGGSSERRYAWYTASLQAYPIARGVFRGAYVRGALGMVAYNSAVVYDTLFVGEQFAVNQRRAFRARDLGGSAGVGFEIPVVWDATIGAYVNYYFATRARYEGPGGPTGAKVGARMAAAGVALTIR